MMGTVQGRTRTILVASVGVGLAMGGLMVLMHRRFKSRLRLIAERVELMEDQIFDLKDLVNEMIKEETRDENILQESLKSKNDILISSVPRRTYKALNKNVSDNNFVKSESSFDDEDDFVEAVEGYYSSVTSGDDYEIADDGGYNNVASNENNIRGGVDNDVKSGDDNDGILKRVDTLFEGGDEGRRKAYQFLTQHPLAGDNVEYLWRLSKATYYMSKLISSSPPSPPSSSSPSSSLSSSSSSPQQLIYKSFELASEAVDADEKSADAHKWYAITLGSTNDYEGVNVRIQNGYIFKEHIERAIELNPLDPSNHHLLGRWAYGVYMLSWVERKVAATLFSTPPSSTVQESLQYFLTAENLNPGKWKENQLFISKCYLELADYKQASDWLRKCQRLPCITNDDRKNQEEILALQTKCSYHLPS